MRDVSRFHKRRQPVEKRRARDFVVVEGENPPARALRVQPGERPVDRLGLRVDDHAVRNRRGGLCDLGGRTVVDRNDDLVDNRPEKAQQCRHSSSRPPGHAVHRE